jgi:hypothetical protein
LSKTGRAESSAPAAKHTTADKVITPHIAAITNRFAFIIFVSFPSLFAELVFLRNRVTPVACWITLHGRRDKPSASLAATCGSINFGSHLICRYPAIIAG